jgi:hypothetical protein
MRNLKPTLQFSLPGGSKRNVWARDPNKHIMYQWTTFKLSETVLEDGKNFIWE